MSFTVILANNRVSGVSGSTAWVDVCIWRGGGPGHWAEGKRPCLLVWCSHLLGVWSEKVSKHGLWKQVARPTAFLFLWLRAISLMSDRLSLLLKNEDYNSLLRALLRGLSEIMHLRLSRSRGFIAVFCLFVFLVRKWKDCTRWFLRCSFL